MGPLAGIRVVDLSSMLSGPWATMILADQGADVIKVEEPAQGDHTRTLSNRHKGFSAQFLNLNRNKRSVTIDLKTGEGVDLLKRLCATADVFVQNFRPGVVERLGIDEEAIRAVAPQHRLRVDQRLRRERPLRQEADLRSHHPGAVGPHQRAGRLGYGAAAPHSHGAARQADGGDGGAGDQRGAGGALQIRHRPARAALHAGCRARVPVGLRHEPADLCRPGGDGADRGELHRPDLRDQQRVHDGGRHGQQGVDRAHARAGTARMAGRSPLQDAGLARSEHRRPAADDPGRSQDRARPRNGWSGSKPRACPARRC